MTARPVACAVRVLMLSACAIALLPGGVAAQQVGGGVESGPVLLEGRWSEGLTNLDAQPTSQSPTIKTRTFLVLGGLRFQGRAGGGLRSPPR
jgi:hypothetical protein